MQAGSPPVFPFLLLSDTSRQSGTPVLPEPDIHTGTLSLNRSAIGIPYHHYLPGFRVLCSPHCIDIQAAIAVFIRLDPERILCGKAFRKQTPLRVE